MSGKRNVPRLESRFGAFKRPRMVAKVHFGSVLSDEGEHAEHLSSLILGRVGGGSNSAGKIRVPVGTTCAGKVIFSASSNGSEEGKVQGKFWDS